MTKSRGIVSHSIGPSLPNGHYIELDGAFEILEWCPDDNAQQPPEQVHLVLPFKPMPDTSLVLRFKSPDTLGFIIEELARYRHSVWPDAEPLDIAGLTMPPKVDVTRKIPLDQIKQFIERVCESMDHWNDVAEDGDRGRDNAGLCLVLFEDGSGKVGTIHNTDLNDFNEQGFFSDVDEVVAYFNEWLD
jgi:hypothetical protein